MSSTNQNITLPKEAKSRVEQILMYIALNGTGGANGGAVSFDPSQDIDFTGLLQKDGKDVVNEVVVNSVSQGDTPNLTVTKQDNKVLLDIVFSNNQGAIPNNNVYFEIIEVTTNSWQLNSEGLYETNMSHNLSSDKVMVQCYLKDTHQKLLTGVIIVDDSNLKIINDKAEDIEVFILRLDNISTFNINTKTNSDYICEDSFNIQTSQLVQDANDADFYDYIINHNLNKTIANVKCLRSIDNEPMVFLYDEIDSNNLKITLMDNTSDIVVKIIYEAV